MKAQKIALIEDDEILSRALNAGLNDAGYKVVQAFDGEAGLDLVRAEKPDLVLLDLILPKKQGLHVLQELKRSRDTRNIPVIILTILENTVTMGDILESGAHEYIIKSSVKVEDIVRRVQEHFRRALTV